MKAIVIDTEREGHPLSWQEVPNPVCGPGEVLTDIFATAVNRADLLQRAGQYPPLTGASPYLGLEMAGVIADTGPGVQGWHPGDRVCALLSGGGYAERVPLPAAMLMRIPDGWHYAKAAAVPEAFYTAFVNLFIEAGLGEGETVLIHGGGSGVGTAAIQLARKAGCRVFVTAGSEVKLECCRQLGAEFGVNYKENDFAETILGHCKAGVDVVLDIAGGGYLASNIQVLKTGGRLVVISLLTGATAEIDLGPVMRKRLRIIGSVLRSRSLAEKAGIARRFAERFWGDLVDGRIAPVIDSVLPITQVEEAHQRLAANRNIGKVVLTVRN